MQYKIYDLRSNSFGRSYEKAEDALLSAGKSLFGNPRFGDPDFFIRKAVELLATGRNQKHAEHRQEVFFGKLVNVGPSILKDCVFVLTDETGKIYKREDLPFVKISDTGVITIQGAAPSSMTRVHKYVAPAKEAHVKGGKDFADDRKGRRIHYKASLLSPVEEESPIFISGRQRKIAKDYHNVSPVCEKSWKQDKLAKQWMNKEEKGQTEAYNLAKRAGGLFRLMARSITVEAVSEMIAEESRFYETSEA